MWRQLQRKAESDISEVLLGLSGQDGARLSVREEVRYLEYARIMDGEQSRAESQGVGKRAVQLSLDGR